MGAMPPAEGDHPVTRRELAKERELIDTNMSAQFALVRQQMATKDDIRNMATKDDIRNMATKDDIRNMATKDDIRDMATKDDIRSLRRELRLQWAVSLATLAAVLQLGV